MPEVQESRGKGTVSMLLSMKGGLMRRHCFTIAVIISMLSTRAIAQSFDAPLLMVNERALVSAGDLIYLSPAATPVEGQPLGNGRMGTLAWTSPASLEFQINRCDVFAVNKNAAKKRDGPTDYCGGCARVTVEPGGQPFAPGNTFQQRLHLYDPQCVIQGDQVRIRCFISAIKDVLALEIDDQRDIPQPIRIQLATWREKEVRQGNHLAQTRFQKRGAVTTLTQHFRERDHYSASAVALQTADTHVVSEVSGRALGNMLSSRFSVSTLTKKQARIPLTISNLRNGHYELTTYHHDSAGGGVWDSIRVNGVTRTDVSTSTGTAPFRIGQASFRFTVTDHVARVLFIKTVDGGTTGDASVNGFKLRQISTLQTPDTTTPPELLVDFRANSKSDGPVKPAPDQPGWQKWTNANTSPTFLPQTLTYNCSLGRTGTVDVTVDPDIDQNHEAGIFPQFRNKALVTNQSRKSARVLTLPASRGPRTVFISSAASSRTDVDVSSAAAALLTDVLEAGTTYTTLHKSHADWWADFWSRSFVHLTSDDGLAQFMNRLRTLHLYYMASSSRGTLPAKWNGSLFSVNGDRREWGSQFWIWTTAIAHHPLYAADASDLADPFFNMYVNQLPAARIAARQRWDARGAYFLEAGPFDGPVILPDAVAQEWQDVYLGRKPCSALSQAARALGQYECVLSQFADGRDCAAGRYSFVSHMPASGSDLAVQAWWRYRHTGDRDFLRTHAYPLLRDTLEFYRSIAVKEADGKYHLYGLNQHEGYWGVNDGIIDLSAIRGTAPLAIRASELLNVDTDLRVLWRAFLKNLAPYTLGGDAGSKALGGGFIADDVWSVGHLGEVKRGGKPGATLAWPIFTFEDWTLETRNPDTDRIVHKIGELNSSRVAIAAGSKQPGTHSTLIMGSRIGRGEDLPVMTGSYYWGSQPLPNGFSEFEGRTAHSIEILGCIATTLQEGLVQSLSPRPGDPETISILPAWPRHWNATFRLLARGGFLVTVSYRDGRVEFVELESRRGEPCRLRNPWDQPCQIWEKGRQASSVGKPLQGPVLVFNTTPGAVFRLLPRGAPMPKPLQIDPAPVNEPVSYSLRLANGNIVGATLGRQRDP